MVARRELDGVFPPAEFRWVFFWVFLFVFVSLRTIIYLIHRVVQGGRGGFISSSSSRRDRIGFYLSKTNSLLFRCTVGVCDVTREMRDKARQFLLASLSGYLGDPGLTECICVGVKIIYIRGMCAKPLINWNQTFF